MRVHYKEFKPQGGLSAWQLYQEWKNRHPTYGIWSENPNFNPDDGTVKSISVGYTLPTKECRDLGDED